jgi:micrococcal nuclease
MFALHRVKAGNTVLPGALLAEGPFTIERVVDGDTLILKGGRTVRLIGVDTPEIHHAEVPVQRFGEEAAEFTRQMAEGFECTIEYESTEKYDHYGRMIAYVFVDGKLLNAEILRRGYGYAYTRYPFKRKAEFVQLEKEARERQYGLWNFSLRDGRLANIATRYESLSDKGKQRFDQQFETLVKKYAATQK